MTDTREMHFDPRLNRTQFDAMIVGWGLMDRAKLTKLVAQASGLARTKGDKRQLAMMERRLTVLNARMG